MSLRNKKHLGDDLGDHLDKMIDSLLEEHKPPYEELKDSPEVLSLLPIARLLKTLRPSPPENFKVKSPRPWLVPALSTLTCLLLAFILIAFFFPGTIPLFARNESNLYYLGPSVYRMRLEVKLDGKIVERELAQVWYISSDTFRIQVKIYSRAR